MEPGITNMQPHLLLPCQDACAEMPASGCSLPMDMTTMIGQASYAAGQIRTAKEGQVLVKEYPSGHMAYIGKKSAKMLKEDLEAFIKSCKGGRNHEI